MDSSVHSSDGEVNMNSSICSSDGEVNFCNESKELVKLRDPISLPSQLVILDLETVLRNGIRIPHLDFLISSTAKRHHVEY